MARTTTLPAPGPSYAQPPLGGRFQLLDLVGVGGMGTVWRAWDLRDLEFVAVKVLTRLDAGHLLRFVQEQGLRIDHPHVTAPLGWVADDERAAFAMRLVAGGSLADLVAEHGPLPERFVAELLDQLLDGLTAVHAAGVVHRDLKPANLLLEATGRGVPHLRIGDFGVAARTGLPADLDAGGGSVGTPGFAAPEQQHGARPHPAADLYAVGVLARVLLGPAEAGRGSLAGFLSCLTEPDPGHRPDAATARRLLRDVVWPGHRRDVGADRPHVPDRLARVGVPAAAVRRSRSDRDGRPRRGRAWADPRWWFAASTAVGAAASWQLLT